MTPHNEQSDDSADYSELSDEEFEVMLKKYIQRFYDPEVLGRGMVDIMRRVRGRERRAIGLSYKYN